MKSTFFFYLLILPNLLSSQTFEKIISFDGNARPYCLIEIDNAFLLTARIYTEDHLNERQTKLLEINTKGEVVKKIKFQGYYMHTITNLWHINDTTYGALGYATHHADSVLKIVYYNLNKELEITMFKQYNTIIDIESILISDICFNKNNNLVYQLSFFFKDYTQNGYYFLEYSNNGICIKDTFIATNIYPNKACITTNKDSGYIVFNSLNSYAMDKNFNITDTIKYYLQYPNYCIIPDVIWENDSILIMSIPYNSDNNNYYMGLSRTKWGKEVIEDKRYDWNELYEMYAYYNSFDTSGNQFYLAATTNFYQTIDYEHDTTGIRIIKAYNDFSINWDKTYRRDANTFLYYIKATRDGGCIVAGTRYDFSKPERRMDLYLLKVDSLGNYTPNSIVEQNMPQNHISLYPNPGNAEINIQLPTNIQGATFTLYSIAGKKVLLKQVNAAQTTINTGHLPTGMYIYELRKNGKVLNRGKWIKQ